VKGRRVNGIVLKILYFPVIYISIVYMFFLVSNGFSNNSGTVTVSGIQILRATFSFDRYNVNWRSTDILTLILLSLPVLLYNISQNKPKLIILLAISTTLTALVIDKSIAILVLLIFWINYFFFNKKIRQIIFVGVASIILGFSLVLVFPDQAISILSEKATNLLLSHRGQIWSTAVLNYNESLTTKLFGVGYNTPLLFKIPYTEANIFIPVSYHSGYLRLLVTRGVIFYYVSLIGLFVVLKRYYLKLSEHGKRVALSYLYALAIMNVSDGSLFSGFGSMFSFVPVFVIVNLDLYIQRIKDPEKLIINNV